MRTNAPTGNERRTDTCDEASGFRAVSLPRFLCSSGSGNARFASWLGLELECEPGLFYQRMGQAASFVTGVRIGADLFRTLQPVVERVGRLGRADVVAQAGAQEGWHADGIGEVERG